MDIGFQAISRHKPSSMWLLAQHIIQYNLLQIHVSPTGISGRYVITD